MSGKEAVVGYCAQNIEHNYKVGEDECQSIILLHGTCYLLCHCLYLVTKTEGTCYLFCHCLYLVTKTEGTCYLFCNCLYLITKTEDMLIVENENFCFA